MYVNKTINGLLDKLVALQTTPGVQPSDIADAVFEDAYTKVDVVKNSNSIVMTVIFIDDCHGELNEIRMRYTYSFDKNLCRVEEKIGKGAYKVQWDRYENVKELLQQLCYELADLNSDGDVNSFLNTLPDAIAHLKPEIYSTFKRAA